MTTGGAGMPAGTSQLEVLITRLDPAVALPCYAQPGDAGVDLTAAEDVDLAPGERAVVRTGIAIALPEGYAGFVHPRSGLAARHGITLVNAPGTVDAGYRGEIKVILLNTDQARAVSLRRGDRIAQLVVQRVEHVTFREVRPCQSRLAVTMASARPAVTRRHTRRPWPPGGDRGGSGGGGDAQCSVGDAAAVTVTWRVRHPTRQRRQPGQRRRRRTAATRPARGT